MNTNYAFEYDEALLRACAQSSLVASVIGSKKIVSTAEGNDEACLKLQELFSKHYQRSQGGLNQEFLSSVSLVHQHNNAKGKTHTLTLNQFSDTKATLSGWQEIDYQNDERVIALHDTHSIQKAAKMIFSSTTRSDDEGSIRWQRHHYEENHSIALDEMMESRKGHNKSNNLPFIQQKSNNHSRPIGQIVVHGTSYQALNVDDYFISSLNWATTNNPDGASIVHPASDQGICGSCWAWAATGSIEASVSRRNAYQSYKASKHHRHRNAIENARKAEVAALELANLSVQELIDCDTAIDDGCTGGNPLLAFYFIHRYGLASSSKYPYIGEENICQVSKVANPIVSVEAWGILTSNHEDNMEIVLRDIGPIAVGLNGADASFLAYKGGVFDIANCDQTANHALLVVGYGQEKFDDDSLVKFWIARNSWGRGWGEDGYVRVKRGQGGKDIHGVCGIARNPSVALGGILLTGIGDRISQKYDSHNSDGSQYQSPEEHIGYNYCDAMKRFQIMQTCHQLERYCSHHHRFPDFPLVPLTSHWYNPQVLEPTSSFSLLFNQFGDCSSSGYSAAHKRLPSTTKSKAAIRVVRLLCK